MPGTVVQHRWSDVASEAVAQGVERRYITGDRVTIAQFHLKKGSVVPRHSHESEQVTQVVTGALKFMFDGETFVVRGGDALQIPSWAPHEVEVLEDTYVIDVFSPVRQDWLDKTDTYFTRSRA